MAYRSPLTVSRKGAKKAFVSTVQRSQKIAARPRTSPLSGLLADYREAEIRWNRERVCSIRCFDCHSSPELNFDETTVSVAAGHHQAVRVS
jgi:hypothetical protein